MAEITLKAETGRPTGSRPSRRLRAEGKVPGVVYGQGEEPVTVAVGWRDLRHALTTEAGTNALIDLDIGGTTEMVIVKDYQRDPIRGTVEHVDFLRIRADQPITVDVPIVLHGEAEEVLRNDGLVDQVLTSLAITAKPGDIPTELPVDVSGLVIGDHVRVGDLTLPAGVTTDVDPEEAVVTAQVAPTTAETEAVEEAEAAEAEAAEGEEGAAEGGDSTSDAAADEETGRGEG